MAPVITIEERDLIERRDALLRDLGLTSYAEFRREAHARPLSDRAWALRDELDSIAYLLGENELTD